MLLYDIFSFSIFFFFWNLKVGSFWVNAKIASVETYGEWYYLSCANCSKKVTPVADSFYCEECDDFDSNGKVRFVVEPYWCNFPAMINLMNYQNWIDFIGLRYNSVWWTTQAMPYSCFGIENVLSSLEKQQWILDLKYWRRFNTHINFFRLILYLTN